MEWMNQLKTKYVKLPTEYVYVHRDDLARLEQGETALAYISIGEDDDAQNSHVMISRDALQPAVKIDDNTFDVVYILV